MEDLLDLSIDPNHPVEQAIDGRLDSYWRELILTDALIEADPCRCRGRRRATGPALPAGCIAFPG